MQKRLQGNVFWDEKISKEGNYIFCKFYDNEGATQLLFRSNHFISPTVWFLFFGLNFIASIPVMISFHDDMVVVSVPCDIGKHQDTSFKMNEFSEKKRINFCKFCDSEGVIQFYFCNNCDIT